MAALSFNDLSHPGSSRRLAGFGGVVELSSYADCVDETITFSSLLILLSAPHLSPSSKRVGNSDFSYVAAGALGDMPCCRNILPSEVT